MNTTILNNLASDLISQNYTFDNSSTLTRIDIAIQEAWNIWEDRHTQPHYPVGEDKPEEPTASFIKEWVGAEDFEADFGEEFEQEIIRLWK